MQSVATLLCFRDILQAIARLAFIGAHHYEVFQRIVGIVLYFWVTGTPALTTRGMKEADFDAVVGFLDDAVQIAQGAKAKTGGCTCTLEQLFT